MCLCLFFSSKHIVVCITGENRPVGGLGFVQLSAACPAAPRGHPLTPLAPPLSRFPGCPPIPFQRLTWQGEGPSFRPPRVKIRTASKNTSQQLGRALMPHMSPAISKNILSKLHCPNLYYNFLS